MKLFINNSIFNNPVKIIGLLFFYATISCSSPEPDQQVNTPQQDPLPSWNEGVTKNAIIDFVVSTTDPNSKSFIPENKRIVVFDNDGTLWSEQPLYFQFLFVIDRIKKMAPEHPEWREKQPFKAVLEDDLETVKKSGVPGLLTLTMASHSGMTTDEFKQIVNDWINTAKHPKTGKLYKEMVYQPMLEVLEYLRANGYKTFIVSGGGIDFMRPWTEEVYGIPPEQVIGSSGKYEFRMSNHNPEIVKLPEIDFIDDKEGKPIGIQKFIGRKPVAAFGNSDGDLQMLQWTASGEGKRLMVYIHHTDAEREWAYDRDSHIGHLDKGLDEAQEKGWIIVDMKNDWNRIYPQ
ncbi:MAG: haloacid dehalogenase-like hydrolase [Bacteroidetes bacterium]|nr:haloacid dehalogenase-like hydrolase [Bacteroidota bacterium]